MLDNLPFYTTLLVEFLGRFFQADLAQDPNVTLLFRASKVSTCIYSEYIQCICSRLVGRGLLVNLHYSFCNHQLWLNPSMQVFALPQLIQFIQHGEDLLFDPAHNSSRGNSPSSASSIKAVFLDCVGPTFDGISLFGQDTQNVVSKYTMGAKFLNGLILRGNNESTKLFL